MSKRPTTVQHNGHNLPTCRVWLTQLPLQLPVPAPSTIPSNPNLYTTSSHPLYRKGFCFWFSCNRPCHTRDALLSHLLEVHSSAYRAAVHIKAQQRVVDVETERLKAMRWHYETLYRQQVPSGGVVPPSSPPPPSPSAQIAPTTSEAASQTSRPPSPPPTAEASTSTEPTSHPKITASHPLELESEKETTGNAASNVPKKCLRPKKVVKNLRTRVTDSEVCTTPVDADAPCHPAASTRSRSKSDDVTASGDSSFRNPPKTSEYNAASKRAEDAIRQLQALMTGSSYHATAGVTANVSTRERRAEKKSADALPPISVPCSPASSYGDGGYDECSRPRVRDSEVSATPVGADAPCPPTASTRLRSSHSGIVAKKSDVFTASSDSSSRNPPDTSEYIAASKRAEDAIRQLQALMTGSSYHATVGVTANVSTSEKRAEKKSADALPPISAPCSPASSYGDGGYDGGAGGYDDSSSDMERDSGEPPAQQNRASDSIPENELIPNIRIPTPCEEMYSSDSQSTELNLCSVAPGLLDSLSPDVDASVDKTKSNSKSNKASLKRRRRQSAEIIPSVPSPDLTKIAKPKSDSKSNKDSPKRRRRQSAESIPPDLTKKGAESKSVVAETNLEPDVVTTKRSRCRTVQPPRPATDSPKSSSRSASPTSESDAGSEYSPSFPEARTPKINLTELLLSPTKSKPKASSAKSRARGGSKKRRRIESRSSCSSTAESETFAAEYDSSGSGSDYVPSDCSRPPTPPSRNVKPSRLKYREKRRIDCLKAAEKRKKKNTAKYYEITDDLIANREKYRTSPDPPPYPIRVLIRQSIVESSEKRLSTGDVFKWVKENFLYYRQLKFQKWGGVQKMLNKEQCFIKEMHQTPEERTVVKWSVDEKLFKNKIFRPKSLHYNQMSRHELSLAAKKDGGSDSVVAKEITVAPPPSTKLAIHIPSKDTKSKFDLMKDPEKFSELCDKAAKAVADDLKENGERYRSTVARPPYTFRCLLKHAIVSSPQKQLTISELTDWLVTNFLFYKNRGSKTTNMIVKTTLPHNKSFLKSSKKGGPWTVSEEPFFTPLQLKVFNGLFKSLTKVELSTGKSAKLQPEQVPVKTVSEDEPPVTDSVIVGDVQTLPDQSEKGND